MTLSRPATHNLGHRFDTDPRGMDATSTTTLTSVNHTDGNLILIVSQRGIILNVVEAVESVREKIAGGSDDVSIDCLWPRDVAGSRREILHRVVVYYTHLTLTTILV